MCIIIREPAGIHSLPGRSIGLLSMHLQHQQIWEGLVAVRGHNRQARAVAPTSISRDLAYSPDHSPRLMHTSSNQQSSTPQEDIPSQVLHWVLGPPGLQRCSLEGLRCQNPYVSLSGKQHITYHDCIT